MCLQITMSETKEPTAYRRQLKRRILSTAMEEFTSRGIRAAKMDDIAHLLSISKRTLYELYANKEDLLLEGVKFCHEQKIEEIHQLAKNCENVMDVVIQYYRFKTDELHRTTPQFYEDVVKYPKVIQYFEEEKSRNRDLLVEFMRRGVEEGCFLDGLNYPLLANIFELFNMQVINSRLYQANSMNEIFYHLLFVTLRGLCTRKGAAILDTFLEQIKEKKP